MELLILDDTKNQLVLFLNKAEKEKVYGQNLHFLKFIGLLHIPSHFFFKILSCPFKALNNQSI
jgi:hypothetical protein